MPRRTWGATLTGPEAQGSGRDDDHHLRYQTAGPKCWLITHPNSGAKPESRRVIAYRPVKWYVNAVRGDAAVHRKAVRYCEEESQKVPFGTA